MFCFVLLFKRTKTTIEIWLESSGRVYSERWIIEKKVEKQQDHKVHIDVYIII
jgi:hypothetical protein